jgi:hypothetical protein
MHTEPAGHGVLLQQKKRSSCLPALERSTFPDPWMDSSG